MTQCQQHISHITNEKDLQNLFNKTVEPKQRLRTRLLLFYQPMFEKLDIEKIILSITSELRSIDYITSLTFNNTDTNNDKFYIVYHTDKSTHAPIEICNKYHPDNFGTSQTFDKIRVFISQLPSTQVKYERTPQNKTTKFYHTAECQTIAQQQFSAECQTNIQQCFSAECQTQDCQTQVCQEVVQKTHTLCNTPSTMSSQLSDEKNVTLSMIGTGDMVASNNNISYIYTRPTDDVHINLYMVSNRYYAGTTCYNLLSENSNMLQTVFGQLQYYKDRNNNKIYSIALLQECTPFTNTLLISNRLSGIECEALNQLTPNLIAMAKQHRVQQDFRVIQNLKTINILMYSQYYDQQMLNNIISRLESCAKVSIIETERQ